MESWPIHYWLKVKHIAGPSISPATWRLEHVGKHFDAKPGFIIEIQFADSGHRGVPITAGI
jgi:hypothetical protein